MCLSGHPTLCVSRAIQPHVSLWSSNLMCFSCHPTSCASLVIQPHVPLVPSNLMCFSCHPASLASLRGWSTLFTWSYFVWCSFLLLRRRRATYSEASISSEAMMHFPLCFRFSPIFKKISDSVKNFKNFTFFRPIFTIFLCQISEDLFLVIDPEFWILPPTFEFSPHIFPVSVYFPPLSRKLFFPLLLQISPCFRKFTCFLHTLCVFRFPHTLTMMHLCITQCTYWTPLNLLS